jgi:hypothetical protein
MSVEISFGAELDGLIARGVLTASVHVSSDGNDCWFRPTQSHPRLGVRTNESLTADDAVRLFGSRSKFAGSNEKTVWAPRQKSLGAEILPMPFRPKVPSPEPNPDVVVTTMRQALQRSQLKNLSVVIRNGISNQLPKDSLSWWDLGREDYDDFSARAFLVAKQVGEAKAVSRIASQPLTMKVVGASDLHEWWFKSSSEQKWNLLSSQAKRGETPKSCLEGLKSSYDRRFQLLPCPFRNSPLNMEKLVKEKESSDEEDQYDYSNGVPY